MRACPIWRPLSKTLSAEVSIRRTVPTGIHIQAHAMGKIHNLACAIEQLLFRFERQSSSSSCVLLPDFEVVAAQRFMRRKADECFERDIVTVADVDDVASVLSDKFKVTRAFVRTDSAWIGMPIVQVRLHGFDNLPKRIRRLSSDLL